MRLSKPDREIFLILTGIWAVVICVWALIMFLNPQTVFDLEDAFIEGLLFLIAVVILFLIRKLTFLIIGWGIFTLALGIDLLDEFVLGDKFFNVFLEGIFKASGLILLFIGFIKVYNEIHKKRIFAEERLEWFKKLIEITPVPCVVYTKDRLVYVNKSAEDVSGYTKEELLRGAFWELIDEEDGEKVRKFMKLRLSGKPVEPYLVRVKRKDGNYRILKVFGVFDEWMGQKFGLISLVDVTQLEEERKKSEDLIKMISLINKILRHDTLNALTTAITYFELYKDEKSEDHYVKVMKSIERAVNIIKNLKNFEEIVKKGEFQRMNVKKVVEDVAKSFNIPIVIEGDCEVFADDGLKVLFENIFQNAVQHSETDRIEVKIKKAEKYCEIRIADFGKGIPDKIKDKIFEEGFTYGEKSSTGLGLYIVKKLVERYFGEIRVEDNYPRGTVFVIRLRAV